MFAEMRRKDREIGPSDIAAILAKAEYGHLATIGTNGYPYSVPLSFVAVENKIYLHGAAAGGSKMANILANEKVCFSVVGETEPMPDKFATLYESVVAFGTARVMEDAEKRAPLVKLLEKYSGDFMEAGHKYIDKLIDKTAIIEITITHATGKARRKTTKSNLEVLTGAVD